MKTKKNKMSKKYYNIENSLIARELSLEDSVLPTNVMILLAPDECVYEVTTEEGLMIGYYNETVLLSMDFIELDPGYSVELITMADSRVYKLVADELNEHAHPMFVYEAAGRDIFIIVTDFNKALIENELVINKVRVDGEILSVGDDIGEFLVDQDGGLQIILSEIEKPTNISTTYANSLVNVKYQYLVAEKKSS